MKKAVIVAALALLIAAAVIVVRLVGNRSAAPPPEPPVEHPRPNVLLITLDTTRADRLGCYGHAAARTPALDSLAAAGVRFARAQTHVPLTLPSHATIMTGLLPPETGLADNGRGRLGPGHAVLAEMLGDRGYDCAAFLASFVLDHRFGLSRGFATYDDRMKVPEDDDDVYLRENSADVVCNRALAWLADRGDKPFFCWVHFYDPHLPYDPPEPFKSKLADPYDGELAFVDTQIARLLDYLDRRGLRSSTLIVAVGDHGESFGQHEEDGHGPLIYQTTMHVPLIVSLPGRTAAGTVSDRLAGLSDIAPTVLDAAGVRPPPAMRGRDLLAGPAGGDADAGVYGESEFLFCNYGWAPLRSITAGRWAYIDCPDPELYDLQADPDEAHNLRADQPGQAAALKARLDGMIADMHAARSESVAMSAEDLRALQQLGYLSGVRAPAATTRPGDLKNPKAMMDVYNACLKAEVFHELGREEEVIALLAPLEARSPESLQVHDYLAGAFLALGRREEARRHIEAVLAIDPSDRTMVANLGSLALDEGKYAEAVRVFRRGLQMTPNPAEALDARGVSKITLKLHTNLGLAYSGLGEADKAIEQYQQVLADAPDHLEALNNLANIYNQRGELVKAIDLYRSALAVHRGGSAVLLANFGVALARQGRMVDAVTQYRRAIEMNPSDPAIRINLGDALMTLGKTDEALDAYRQAVRVAPPQAPRPPLVLGMALARLGRNDEALVELRRSLAIQETPGTRNNIGMLLTQLGRPDEAIAEYRKALALEPAFVAAWNNLGLTLSRKKEYAQAIAAWRDGLAKAPDDPMLLYNLAWWLATCPDASIRDGGAALKLARQLNEKTGGNNFQVLDALAAAWAETGQFEQAAEQAEAAVRLARAAGGDRAAPIELRLAGYKTGRPFHQSP
ncbi:MAG: Photosystem I assembly protein Ycf3 [Phycisphaerae bacterium]|nr:Photosystem I assembly protein Ycf3 [Phycisphaerae bacterium]